MEPSLLRGRNKTNKTVKIVGGAALPETSGPAGASGPARASGPAERGAGRRYRDSGCVFPRRSKGPRQMGGAGEGGWCWDGGEMKEAAGPAGTRYPYLIKKFRL